MKPLEIIPHSSGNIRIQGDLTFASLHKKIIHQINFALIRDVTIDLNAVTHCDSAGLALVIEWIKQSQRHQTTLTLIHLPAQLLTLAKMTGLENNDYFIK